MKPFTKKIVLENGEEFYGYGFGANRDAVCEIVFNTGMVGYQEVISDPACFGQMIVFTYPLIGNYGMTDDDYESKILSAGALVVREYNDMPSNFRYTKTLAEVLEENDIPGISGVDSRKLVGAIRDKGITKAIITDVEVSVEEAMSRIAAHQTPTNAIERVSCRKRWFARTENHTFDVVAIDCGLKYSMIRALNNLDCNVTVVPYNTSVEAIKAFGPDGLLISSGPGNPMDATVVMETIKALKGQLPIFGVGMGHQLIGLAYGAQTYKMEHGHCGGHPVKSLIDGKVESTAQNHGYAVCAESLKGTKLEVTHIDILDKAVEGMECVADGVFSVQYQPESAPGPQDSAHLFDKFINIMSEKKNG